MSLRRKQLVAGAVVAGIGAALGLSGVFGATTDRAAPPPQRTETGSYQDLVAILQQLRRSWNPAARHRVVARARQQEEHLIAPLLWLLSRTHHELITEAIRLAADLDLARARPFIRRIAKEGPKALQPRAIKAVARLQPWSPQELEEFLDSSETPILLAVLQAAAKTPGRPMPAILGLIAHPEREVREAVLAAIPRRISSETREVLRRLVHSSSELEATGALQAIGRTELDADTEQLLLESLDNQSHKMRAAALAALAAKREPLRLPAALWSRTRGPGLDRWEKARVLLCLERTRSFSLVAAVKMELTYLEPYQKYFAGRYLIAAGDTEGIEVLLELLDTSDFLGGDEDESKEILLATRRLLGQLSGTTAYAGEEVWRSWLRDLKGLRQRPLPAPALEMRDG